MGIPEMIGTIELSPRAILNPGSVGQPRDRDNRAAYAIFDLDRQTWKAYRAAYDIIRVQKLILDGGLPPRHAVRLSEGW
jgi:diadenosine tetraphosphatase ApaH/serine/threonine PP2A family protein phosphatase